MSKKTRIALKYISEENDEAEIFPDSFKPLGYEDLIERTGEYPIEARISAGNAKLNGEILTENTICKFPINFNNDVTIYVLAMGGWLPFTFLNEPKIIPDRNVISSIKEIKSGKLRENTKKTEWWLRFFKKSDLTINPILYAFEGNLRRLPTYNEFCTSFDEAVFEIKQYFPNANVISYPEKKYYKAAYEILEDLTSSFEREQEFLIKTSPLVATIPADNEIEEIQDTIDDIALRLNILGDSLAYYLVLSCLYDNKDNVSVYHAARKVLKPKHNYTEKHAYNAISDLNAMILFLQSLSLPKHVFSVCTCDKPLATFWTGLNPIERNVKNKKINITFSVNENLFPRLGDKQRQQLVEKIENKKSF
jgi:hypothetical protein